MISIQEALDLISANVSPLASETNKLKNCVGRILAKPVIADVDSPPHTKSVMDGFAVRAQDVSRNCNFRVIETITAGEVPQQEIVAGTAARIMTGAPLPDGADAVVMIEKSDTSENADGCFVSFDLDSLVPGRHAMQKASSFKKGELIFPANHRVRPLDIGLLAEVGADHPEVFRQPTASVLPTGNELVGADQLPGAGQIRNSNGPMLVSLLTAAGVTTIDLGIGSDDANDLRPKIDAGLQSDFLILSGGVSAGLLDLVPALLQQAGVEQIFHKVKIKPGKPIWFGVLKSSDETKYVFGLPGNPVSSLIGFELFVKAAISRMNGFSELQREMVSAELVSAHEARGDRPTYWPGSWVRNSTHVRQVQPLKWMGSSDLRSLGTANALIYFPPGEDLHKAGEIVQVLSID